MSDQVAAQPAASADSAGCVVFLIDESAALDARVADGTKSKAESIATALNSLLQQLTAGPRLDLAVVGYRRWADGQEDIGCRWGGPLAGRTFVAGAELAAAPLAVEQRVRKVPGGVGVARQQTVPFPVWYVPTLGAAAPRAAAYQYCFDLLSAWGAAAGEKTRPPLLVSFLGDVAPEELLSAAARGVDPPGCPAPPLIFHAHLSSSARVPPTVYPSAGGHLPPGAVREVFAATSVLPEPLSVALRAARIPINAGARGMVYNARMLDLIRFLSLVRTYATAKPQAIIAVRRGSPDPAETADRQVSHGPGRPSVAVVARSGDRPQRAAAEPQAAAARQQITLVVLLLDRSAAEPAAAEKKNAWTRLQEHANDLLAQISQRGGGRIETAVVAYGAAADGGTDVQIGLAGPLAGRAVVPAAELAGGPLRVEEVAEKFSNGIGGLVEVTRRKPVFIDLEPTAAAAPAPAFEAVAKLAADWCGQHPGSPEKAIVLHLTRGKLNPDAPAPIPGEVRLYHLVVTESPHRSLSYPGRPDEIDDPMLQALWQQSSPLLGARRLAAERPSISVDARGIVINGKFDLLLDGIFDTFSPLPQRERG